MAQEKSQNRTGTRNRGFASMDPQKQREIASKGGKAAHLAGTAHEFTPEEAREAGRKGGQASGGARAARALAFSKQKAQNTTPPLTTEEGIENRYNSEMVSGDTDPSESSFNEPDGNIRLDRKPPTEHERRAS